MKILNYVISFSIMGTALRMALEHISNFPDSAITYVAIPQIVGCFIFGSALEEDGALSKGLQIGLAGSLTTFSGWMFSIFTDFVNFYSFDRPLAASIYAGFLNILVIIAVAFSAFFYGIHSSNNRFLKLIRLSDTPPKILAVISGGLWILSLLLAILVNPICYALVLAPLGSLCRYFVSLKLNSWIENIPLGTFLCNMIGTIIFSACLIISYYSQDSCVVIRAITIGFCGNLTTLSSFVNELFSNDKPLNYFILSLLSGLFFVFIMDGTFLLLLGLCSSDFSCFKS
jgi:fluoride ion exporter CrcB/FEX